MRYNENIMKQSKTKQPTSNLRLAIIIGSIVLSVFIAFVFALRLIQHAALTSNNLGQCISASNNQRLCTGQFFGLTEKAAMDLGKDYGVTVRTVERNGEGLIITEDYSNSRINIEVKNGVVKGVDIY